MWHRHDREGGAAGLLVRLHELADTGAVPGHDVVREDDREGLMADHLLGHQHRMTEAELLLLAHVAHLGHVADLAHTSQHLDITARFEQRFELETVVEVILDGPLLAARDDDDLLDAGSDGLLDRVLDDGLVDERQHLLGLCLRGGQEACPPARGGEDCLANAHRSSVALAGPGPLLVVGAAISDASPHECTAWGPRGHGQPVRGPRQAPSGSLGRLGDGWRWTCASTLPVSTSNPPSELQRRGPLCQQQGRQEHGDHGLQQHEDGVRASGPGGGSRPGWPWWGWPARWWQPG